jgi:hypothetical protein
MRGYNKTCTPHLYVNKSNGVHFVEWLLAVDSCCMHLNANFISLVSEPNWFEKKYGFRPPCLFFESNRDFSKSHSFHQDSVVSGSPTNSAISFRTGVILRFYCYGWLR